MYNQPRRLNITDLNNAAVQQIEDGDFQSATQILTGALKLMMIQHHSNDGMAQSSSRRKAAPQHHFAWSKNASSLMPPLKRKKLIQEDNNDEEEDKVGTYIFARGMYVHGPLSLWSGEIKAVITYNAALAAHLLAVHQTPGNNNSTLLSKAHALYRLSRACLKKQRESSASSNSSITTSNKLCHQHFFHMAILNNLGQLSYELVDYECSKICFDQLHRNVMHLLKYEKPDVYSKSDLNGMIANSIVEIPTTAPCA